MFFLGCLAFVLFFLSDYNDAQLHHKPLIICFPLGLVMLIMAVLSQLNIENAPFTGVLPRIVFGSLFVFFTGLTIYTLFFSFPFDSAYAAPGIKRPVCNTGVYALCRHPGVIWLAAVLFCLWLLAGLPLFAVITYTLLNIALVAFEDCYVFPIILSGYLKYKNVTPFLIPTPSSIKAAFCKSGQRV